MKRYLFLLITLPLLAGCNDNCKDPNCMKPASQQSANTGNAVTARNGSSEVSCKLTTSELQQRKETVLASLKKQVLEKKELPDGYAFRFNGSDQLIDELTEFIKSERACCSFFVFNLSVSGDGKEIWLSLTGPEGTREMIAGELGL